MTALANPKDNGELALDIYAHFHSKPGYALVANNFLAIAKRRRIAIRELQDSIESAVRAGWLDDGPNGSLRLTERGFKRMAEIGAAT